MAPRPEPIIIPALQGSSTTHKDSADLTGQASIIFVHGLGDDGDAVSSIARQFQGAQKLPHLRWIFPTAPENRDLMQRAWYIPTPLSPFAGGRPELDEPEDEAGVRASVAYVTDLVEQEAARGVPLHRVVVAGFSQGCALALHVGLASRLAGRIAGVAGFAGYLPLGDALERIREEEGVEAGAARGTPFWLMRGTRDMLVPKRYFNMALAAMEKQGVKDLVEIEEYEGLGHAISGPALRDFCAWLERVVPAVP